MDSKRVSVYSRFREFIENDLTDHIPDDWYIYKFIKSNYPDLEIHISKCKHHDVGLVRPNGTCAICIFEKHGFLPSYGAASPRQVAYRNGDYMYTPELPCPTCVV